ncbi:hypothetical protein Kpol_1028p57 [Vanderwaltozyma polyspora DSM 70294]|uniref:Ribosomal protein L9 domain-containing protein n=1 Tax=Vanderwaltozyma polyspora (strain ATCC 22028 / DSM 70294 / BCRC 21397 / CBS 2163 / NBRC 10782 / NRRL Y-8283 / UCD 57-17) TaxID=436907 RepID=A7TG25_VANPO|nr:uncharacterized protein Kpol_1028p57 [Vanderwaltozyma polyspora DSM 70294]EDO18782.1 hypothetical protein Kpol_1028p57 [Vanderwaltozyma polyspora DSM 70294]
MFRPSSVCLSALSKRTVRVKVQVLRDFPVLKLFRGQVLSVIPSLMRNQLHNENGARYILKDSDIDNNLQDKHFKRMKDMRKLEAKRQRDREAALLAAKKYREEQLAKSRLPKPVLGRRLTLKKVRIPGLHF